MPQSSFFFFSAALHGNLSIVCYILKYAHVLWVRHCVRYQGIQRCAHHRPCAQGGHHLRVDVKHPKFLQCEVSHQVYSREGVHCTLQEYCQVGNIRI